MAFVETVSGFPIWKLTRPSKLALGMLVTVSGSILAAHSILIG
nr:hypothetical protein [uncultured Novosphingobium sp.]